jgi:acetoacetyl-CoA reductase
MTAQEWREVIDTDLTALMYTCHFAVPMLLENGWGRIINIASTTGQLVITFGQANYAAAKAGVIGFTKALAVELARNNITVNVVAIGAMATEMWDTVPDVIKEKIYERIPMHRACTTEEVLTAAASGSLKPPPTRRLRWTYHHLSYSIVFLQPVLATTYRRTQRRMVE